MTTRLETSGPLTQIDPSLSAPRVTDSPKRPFREVMASGARIVLDGADAALQRLPGGPVIAAALRPGVGVTATGTTTPEGSAGTATATRSMVSGDAAAGTTGSAVEDQLAQSADQNLYYLQLQERISAESREYSALSNVLKARHDTVKNAIGNIR